MVHKQISSLNQKGFTLIELLVVIAIIGILATIVLIGLNPIARLTEASQAKAQADVRQGGSIAEACVTKELGGINNSSAYWSCGSSGYLTTNGNSYARNVPSGISFSGYGTAVCVWEAVGVNASYWYSTSVGKTSNGRPTSCP